MSSSPKGYPTQKKDDLVVGAQFATVQPLDQDKYGQDVHASMYVRVVGSDVVEAGSTKILINAAAHAAKVGDILRMTSGATLEQRVRVIKVETNVIHITELSAAPSATDTFDILRHTSPKVNADGSVDVTATLSQAPIQFDRNGTDTEVREDTVTPANSRPLPVKALDASGNEVDFATEAKQDAQTALLTTIDVDTGDIANNSAAINNKLPVTLGQKTMANSLAVVIASDQSAIDVDANVVSTVLPPDAATETTLNNVNSNLATIAGAVAGSEIQVDVVSPLPAGTNNIGDVDVLSLPSLPAGTNNIGDVDVLSLPSIPAGTNNIGDVDVLTLPSIPAGSNTIGAVNVNNLTVVDFIDTTPVLDASVTTINGSAGAFVTLVASLAADVKKLQLLDTTGAFLGLYTGPAASEVLAVIVGPGSDQTIECAIPSGTRVSVRRLDSTTNVTTGNLAINFLG